jgi:class 3 adenylate cyclase
MKECEDIKNQTVWTEETRKALVSNKNIILYYYYLKNHFSAKGGLVDIGELLFEDENEKKFFLDKEKWCTLDEYVCKVERAIELTGNFRLPIIVGSLLTKFQNEYKLEEFWQAMVRDLKAVFFGPLIVFRHISFFNYLFNQTKDMDLVHSKNGEAIIKIKFKEGVDPVFDFVSEWHIEGIFKSVLDLFKLQNTQIRTNLKEYDLKKLIETKFHNMNKRCYIVGEDFYLGRELIAKKVSLVKEHIRGKEYFLGGISAFESESEPWAWQAIKDVYLENKYLVISKGDVYNAPYFITQIRWEKSNYFKNLTKLLSSKFSDLSPLGRNYARLIQERLHEEQENNRLMIERKKLEKEMSMLLRRNYINEKFIEKARLGPIPFRDVDVTNIFLDIWGSTEIRKKYGDEAFRRGRNILLHLIKKNLAKTAGEWGWLNKVMGDGCYIVLGSYNYFRTDQDFEHTRQAVAFIANLIEDLEKIGTLAGLDQPDHLSQFKLRFGVESGRIEMGESHENDFGSIFEELELGALRVFDTDGRSAHLAKRIEEAAKNIIAGENGQKRNCVLLGPDITDRLKGSDCDIKYIDLMQKGIIIPDFEDLHQIAELCSITKIIPHNAPKLK